MTALGADRERFVPVRLDADGPAGSLSAASRREFVTTHLQAMVPAWKVTRTAARIGRGTCVTASVLACDALALFGIGARPLVAQVSLKHRSGYSAEIGTAQPRWVSDNVWDGHLVTYVPSTGSMLDLTLDQAEPHGSPFRLKPILATLPDVLPITPFAVAVRGSEGAYAYYALHPEDTSWQRTPGDRKAVVQTDDVVRNFAFLISQHLDRARDAQADLEYTKEAFFRRSR